MAQVASIVLVLAVMIAELSGCAGRPSAGVATPFQQADFESLLSMVAQGWNTNDSALAAAAFAVDAIYAEPPAKQLYSGREAIFEFFGGPDGRKGWMNIQWHNISFNQQRQTGAGEFTFSWEGGQVHGMVSIQIQDGLISRWREYFYASDLTWENFQRPSAF